MAVAAHSTSGHLVETILAGDPGRIAALFALRSGVVALVDHLAKVCERVEDGGGPDNRAEKSFNQALDELFRLDDEIMGLAPADIEDLRLQAAIVQYSSDDREFVPAHVHRLLASIAQLAA